MHQDLDNTQPKRFPLKDAFSKDNRLNAGKDVESHLHRVSGRGLNSSTSGVHEVTMTRKKIGQPSRNTPILSTGEYRDAYF